MVLRNALFGCLVALRLSGAEWYATRIESPTYPPLATQARIEGEVVLKLTIGPDGSVTQADVLSGSPVLASTAKSNVLTWRFSAPCNDKGQKPSVIEFTYEFKLEGETQQRPTTTVRYEHPFKLFVISQAQYWNPNAAKTKDK